MKKRILLDCDGVLADFCSLCFDFIEKNTGKKFAYEDVTQWDIFEALNVKHLENDFRSYIAEGGKCLEIKPYHESIAAINDLKKDFEIVVVTSPLNVASWVVERTQWLKKHFDFKKEDVIFATRKECVSGDFIIDDHVENSRNKAKLALYGDSTDIQFGFYDSHLNFKRLEECPLHMQGLNDILPVLKIKS
jgi:5'(3')-deoxyribonucleotidase